MNFLKSLSVSILVICSHAAFSQQLLLGKNPYAMNKSAVLELNSDNQGFLLPRISDTTLINALTPPDGMVIYFVPTKQILWRANGYWKALAQNGNYITGLTGDVTATGPGSATATVTGLRGAALPALSSGFLKFDGTSWFFDNTAYLTASTNTLQTVTTAGNTSNTGVVLTENGNSPSNSYALKLLRANDTNPQGYLIRGQNSGGSADLFSVNVSGDVTGNSFIKSGGTASQFLKADGSVDNNTYLTGNQTVTLSGDISGSGTTGITTTIGNGKITYAKIQNTSMSSGLLGRYAGTPGSLQEITIGSGLALSTSGVLSATNTNNGTVTSVSINSANGLAGTVATASSTPAITLSTTVTGILKGNGTALLAATAGTDYVAPNASITGATKTKITYDSKGLVTAGADATTSDIAEGVNLYYTDARVRATALTGLSTATATAVIATDNVVTGVGKLQGQINTINSAGYITNANVVFTNQANAYSAGMKQTFISSATTAGLNLAGVATDPTTLTNGDIWTNATSNLLKTRLNGTTQEIITSTSTQTLTNKTLSGLSNTFSNIPNSALTNSTIGLTLGSTGTDANISGSPASLGGSLTLNLPSASATNRGLLTSMDWSTFNSKAPATGGSGYIQNQVAANQTADMRISGKALVGGPSSDNGAALQVAGNATMSGNVAIGTASPNASLDVNGSVAIRMGSYTAVNGANDNLNINNSAFIRVSGPTSVFSIDGIAGGYDGRMVILFNATDYDMTLTHNASSTAANGIFCSDDTSILVKKKGCATLMYSLTDSRWIVVSTN